jgi:hypothetical protein
MTSARFGAADSFGLALARVRKRCAFHRGYDALAIITTHFDRDWQMNAVRQKALGDLERVLGTKLAVRALQIDRRLSFADQLQILSKLPLTHRWTTIRMDFAPAVGRILEPVSLRCIG